MARREFAKVGTDMPDEPSIKALTVGAQWLYDRFLFSKELSRCGVLPLRIALWSDRAPDATQKKVQTWLKELTNSRHVIVDDRYSEVLVRTYVRHDGLLGQPNVVAAMVSDYQLIASPAVRTAFLAEIRRMWDLNTLSDGERGGWCLAMGHYPEKRGKDDHRSWPSVIDGASLARLQKSIGLGLRAEMDAALARQDVPSFDEASEQGIPEPFDRTLHRTPSRGRDRGERRLPTPTTTTGAVAGPPAGDEPTRAGSGGPTGLDLLHTHEHHLGQLPEVTVRGLTKHLDAALAAGTPPATCTAALEEWRRRPGAKPGLLPHLVADATQATHEQDPLTHPDAIAFLAEQTGATR
jgi:hypothetical protein